MAEPDGDRASTAQRVSELVGIVLGSVDATPLEFWIGVSDGKLVQLDDLVLVDTVTPDGEIVRFYGIVDIVRKKYEGAQFDTDAFRAVAGTLPVDTSYSAHVQVTRIDPEVFIPPQPGDSAKVVRGEDFQRALYFDQMERRVAIGLTRTGEPVYANLEFLDGTRGAHVSISGVSGVATKTSYASFLLYSLFHSSALGTDATNAKALIFNVKGEDLLWLDKPNSKLEEQDRIEYGRLGLPAGPFGSVSLFAPARRRSDTPMPDTGGRQLGVRPYLWTIRDVARDRLLRFAFAEADDVRAQISFVITRVERALEHAAADGDPTDPAINIDGTRVASFSELVDFLDGAALQGIAGGLMTGGTLDAFRRRLHAAAQHMGHLVRGDPSTRGFSISWADSQVTVVDIHTLHSIAQMFVVGSLLKRMMEQKELQGTSRPLIFVVLDELNKYAPREGWSPLSDVLLDIAERGRSLGVSLFGAQQTASEVERRVLANAALKVVGRLDAAESERSEYGFLTRVARLRATLLQPGSMIVAQPEIPTPLLLRFPFPAWATRESESASGADKLDPFARIQD
ncbi:MAG: ATP-binding protein [Candidatus Binataceae bacterium]